MRAAFHGLIRRFGLLETGCTPCGQPITVTQSHVLMELLTHPRLKQGELADALGLSKSATSRMVVGLERLGWLARSKDPDDARIRRLHLTEGGRRLAAGAEASSLDRFSALLDAVPSAKRAEVIEALRILQRAIPSQQARPSPRENRLAHNSTD